jgi:putative CocE/NonD family hydrolase
LRNILCRRGESAIVLLLVCLFWILSAQASTTAQSSFLRAHYNKIELDVPMRDGVKLFTVVYIPRDSSHRYPILLQRTPYSAGPYGPNIYPQELGPAQSFVREGYIFAYQDVRGKFMSDGEFVDMRPETADGVKVKTDESTDTYDTIDWLLKKVPNNNGRVGMWGVSYPGFYAAAGMINSHPALKAVSPQAPISDWFIGDDFHHNGALFLLDAFSFMSWFGVPRPTPTPNWPTPIRYDAPDVYQFFRDLGPVSNVKNGYFKDQVAFWDSLIAHPNDDAYWQDRDLLSHLHDVKTAVLLVGGWFDAEDLYGPLKIYKTMQEKHIGTTSTLVMGPWFHGAWEIDNANHLGDISFGSNTASYFRDDVELPFFNYYLKDQGALKLPKVLVFETGANAWRSYDRWPPPNTEQKSLYFNADKRLTFDAPEEQNANAADSYVSDPANPVPYTPEILDHRTREYMIRDQRFAAARPDVLTFQTDPLTADVRIAGPIKVNLYASTTGSDCDVVVKVIDVYPDNTPNNDFGDGPIKMSGYEMLLRGDVMRARFRNSYSTPEPLTPNAVTPISYELRDVCHTFLKGHSVMIQVQSSWFPLVDMNPQTFVDIYQATIMDFRPATIRLYRSAQYPSRVTLGVQRD